MQDLLPSFERELAFLRQHAGDFAERYPKIAGQLLMNGDAGEDPHVERMIQSFALLASRIHKRLDDDFPLFTESFLEVLYPHYLRPFPSCSIAAFGLGEVSEKLVKKSVIERGTALETRPIRGEACQFRTAFDVELVPVRVADVAFRGAVAAPDGTVVPMDGTTAIAVRLELCSEKASWAGLGIDSLRLHLDGESSQVSALREALCGRVLATLVQTAPHGRWARGGDALPRAVGFADEEALFDYDARSHPAYRLLTEYFAFPEKFNFIDLPLPRVLLQSTARVVTLHYVMAGLRTDSDEARLLETVGKHNLVLGCTPVVNLFAQNADPITVNHASESYPVLANSRRAYAYEVYSVDKVYRVQKAAKGETILEFKPFYSLQHDHLLREGETGGRYWTVQRNATLARQSPGYETEISIVDIDFNPSTPQTNTLSIDVTATNRDLPSLLSIGNADGDLTMKGGISGSDIHLLRKPTRSHRFESGRGAHWRLISHLSLNHLSLSAGGIDALRELLRCRRRPNFDHPRRLNFDQGSKADFGSADCG